MTIEPAKIKNLDVYEFEKLTGPTTGHTLSHKISERYCSLDKDKKVKSQWINIKDKLPNRGEIVLILDSYGTQYVGALRYGLNEFEYSSCCGCYVRLADITHWMPLPDPPIDVTE